MDARGAGLAQRHGDLVRNAKMGWLCQRNIEQVRIMRGVEKRLGRGVGEMQDCIELAVERGRSGFGKNPRGEKAVDHDEVDLEIFGAQRAGEIA